jgi:hypothetical protein
MTMYRLTVAGFSEGDDYRLVALYAFVRPFRWRLCFRTTPPYAGQRSEGASWMSLFVG